MDRSQKHTDRNAQHGVGYVLLDLFLCHPRKVELTMVCGCQGWGGRWLVAVKAYRHFVERNKV